MKKCKKKRRCRYYSMRVSVALLVFTLMLWSGFLTAAIMFVLNRLFGKIALFNIPAVLVAVSLFISGVAGTCFSPFMAKYAIRPIEKVIKAMKKIEKGDFSVRVEEQPLDTEINELIRSFNKMAEELEGIEMFREDFINSFSHEFKTPIVSIQGFAKQLKKTTLSEEKKAEYIDIIIGESNRLTKLSSNVLLLTKLENQQIITDKVKFCLDEQIRNCILLLEKQWSAKDIEFDIDMQNVEYETNPDMLSQAWLNIVGNAIKFSPPHGKIKVYLSQENDVITAEISDSGIGMKEETMHHIFEKFYQGDAAHSGEGNGLGLPMVKRIIELCDGSIRVESQYGHGTSFIVKLPK